MHSNSSSKKYPPKVAPLLRKGFFEFNNLEEAHILANFLAETCPHSRLAILGITEILVNALEHGNLGITFEEKSALHLEDKWVEEINRRLSLPEHENKWVSVRFRRVGNEITLVVTDQGKGFDWRKYHVFNSKKKLRHGRGILVAKHFAFKSLSYSEKGNEVTCVIDSEETS